MREGLNGVEGCVTVLLASTHCTPGLPKLIPKTSPDTSIHWDRWRRLALDQHDRVPVVLGPEQGWSVCSGPVAAGLVEVSRICAQGLKPSRANDNH